MVVTVVSAYKKGVIMYTLETRSLLCVAFKNVDDVYDVAQFINNAYVFRLEGTKKTDSDVHELYRFVLCYKPNLCKKATKEYIKRALSEEGIENLTLSWRSWESLTPWSRVHAIFNGEELVDSDSGTLTNKLKSIIDMVRYDSSKLGDLTVQHIDESETIGKYMSIVG